MYSALVVERAVNVCLLEHHVIAPPAVMKMYPGLGQGRGYDDFELCIRDFEVRVSCEINSKEVLSQLDKVLRDVVSVDSS